MALLIGDIYKHNICQYYQIKVRILFDTQEYFFWQGFPSHGAPLDTSWLLPQMMLSSDNLTVESPILLKEGELSHVKPANGQLFTWYQLWIQGSGCMMCAGVLLSQVPLLSLAGTVITLVPLAYHCSQGINLSISGALRRMTVSVWQPHTNTSMLLTSSATPFPLQYRRMENPSFADWRARFVKNGEWRVA